MKTKLVIILLLLTGVTFSQGLRKHHWGPKEKMEQLEKIKLLEVLDLSEEESIRFFARRNEFKEEHKKIMDERETLLFEMEQAIKKGTNEEDFDYLGTIEKIVSVEKKMVQQRADFINSLGDLLSTEQRAKLVVFESKFMQEVRDALMRRRGRD